MPPRKEKDDKVGESLLETIYKTKIRYLCPKRGWVEEEVEVKRYKSVVPPSGTTLDIETLEPAPEELN